jgi:hypothetical protein
VTTAIGAASTAFGLPPPIRGAGAGVGVARTAAVPVSAKPGGALDYQAPERVARAPTALETLSGLAQAGWEETASLFFPIEVLADYAKFAVSNPAGAAALTSGGLVGGLQTALFDMPKGLFDMAWQGARLLAFPEEEIPKLVDRAGKLCSYLSQHGREVPDRLVIALKKEVREISALYAKGDPVSLWNAGRRAGHLASAVFAAVEGGGGVGRTGLAKGGALLGKARTTESTIVATLRELGPEQTPQAVRMVGHLAARPQVASRVPRNVLDALQAGLERNAGEPGAKNALRQLREIRRPGETRLAAPARPAAAVPKTLAPVAAGTTRPRPASVEQLIQRIDFKHLPAADKAAWGQALREKLSPMTFENALRYLRNLDSSEASKSSLRQRAQQIRFGGAPSGRPTGAGHGRPKSVGEVVQQMRLDNVPPGRVPAYKAALTDYLTRNGYGVAGAQKFVDALPGSPKMRDHLTQMIVRRSGEVPDAAPSRQAQLPSLDFGKRWVVPLPGAVNNIVPMDRGSQRPEAAAVGGGRPTPPAASASAGAPSTAPGGLPGSTPRAAAVAGGSGAAKGSAEPAGTPPPEPSVPPAQGPLGSGPPADGLTPPDLADRDEPAAGGKLAIVEPDHPFAKPAETFPQDPSTRSIWVQLRRIAGVGDSLRVIEGRATIDLDPHTVWPRLGPRRHASTPLDPTSARRILGSARQIYPGVGLTLRHAKIAGANLTGINLHDVDFTGADLRGVDFRGVDLRGANLTGADLTGANFEWADLTGADLRGASFDLSTNFSKATLDQSALDSRRP